MDSATAATDLHKARMSEPVTASTPVAPAAPAVPSPPPSGVPAPSVADAAPLPPAPSYFGLDLNITPAEPEIRKDYLFNYYVLIATKRHTRPFDHAHNDEALIETAASPKLWEQKQVMTIKGSNGQWQVMVVENKFPSLSLDQPKAYGKQEILIETPRANVQFGNLSEAELTVILQGYIERIKALNAIPNIQYVLIFKNEGKAAGASLAHAHTQITALPMVPDKFVREAKVIEDYVIEHKKDPFDAIISFEQREKLRVIEDNNDFISFCPYAPLWDMEAWIMPKSPLRSLAGFTPTQLTTLAGMLSRTAGKLSRAQVAYNFYLEEGISDHHRFAIKLRARNVISPWGGLEVATAMKINTIPSEAAARWYRQP